MWMKKFRILVKKHESNKVYENWYFSGIFSDNCRVTLDEADSWMSLSDK